MKKLFCTLAVTGLILPMSAQDVPPPDRILPADTLAMITVPDMANARRLSENSSHLLLWADPAVKAFKDKFLTKLDEEVIKPFEQKMGVQLTNYFSLAQGQFTVAVTRNGWNGAPGTTPGMVVLIDSKGESARMKSAIDELRKRWQDNGNPMKTEAIRGVEFSVLLIPRKQIDELNPGADGSPADAEPADDLDPVDPEKDKPMELFVGQSGTLFLASNSRLDLEKVLSLQFGGPVMSLAESRNFLPDYHQSFRDATLYGWVNFQPIVEAIQDSLPAADPNNPFAFSPDKIFRATGLSGMRTIAFASSTQGDGEHFDFSIKVPEPDRRGLFRLLTFEAKDAAPPAFVPQDAVNFVRYRLNMLKSWNALETMISEISPQIGGMLRMSLEAIGKDKDATFDFRRQFVENLGDDMVSWRKLPRENTIEAMASQPEVVLIGSPNAEELSGALKTLVGMAPPDLIKLEEREFLGRKIWSVDVPTGLPVEGQDAPPSQTITFSSSRGYLAIASDVGLLEEFLRSNDGGSAPLIDKSGLRFASEKVGGMNTGFYGFSNDRETMRYVYKFLTSDDGTGTAGMSGLNQFLAAMGAGDDGAGFSEWIDLSLLPPFGQIEKYFDYTVYSGAVNPEGYLFRAFTPRPRGL